MDNKYDLLIYAALAILGLLGNAYRGYVKRKEEQERKARTPHTFDEPVYESSEADNDPFPDFETIFNIPKPVEVKQVEVFDEVEEPVEVEDPVEVIEPVAAKATYNAFATESVEIPTEFDYEADNEAPESLEEIERNSPIYANPNNENVKSIMHDFEPAKAVIFSEILNRPDF